MKGRDLFFWSAAAVATVVVLALLLHLAGFVAAGREIAWERIAGSLVMWLGSGLVAAAVAGFAAGREKSTPPRTVLFLALALVPTSAVLHLLLASGAVWIAGSAARDGWLVALRSFGWVTVISVHAILLASGWLLGTAIRAADEARRRELTASELRAKLEQTRLQTLKVQLQPHFLFNSLNAVAALAEEDPAAAAGITRRLRALLHAAVEREHADLVPLRDDLALALDYLEIQRSRFRDRLSVHTEIDVAALDVLVPHFLLQPLVENAVQHGAARSLDPVSVTIRAQLEGTMLGVEVDDDGPGGSPSARPGLGLGNTRERLQQLFGGAASLQTGEGANGGFRVTIALPSVARGGAA